MKNDWRKNVDERVRENLEKTGFIATDQDFTFVKTSGNNLEYPLRVTQRFRGTKVVTSTSFIVMSGVIHRQVAEMVDWFLSDSKMRLDENWDYRDFQFWLIQESLEEVRNTRAPAINRNMNSGELLSLIDKTTDEAIVLTDSLMTEFDSLKKILDALLKSHRKPDGRACMVREYKIIASYIALGEFDEAIAFIDKTEKAIAKGVSILTPAYFPIAKERALSEIRRLSQ